MVKLGSKVRDLITGYEGIASVRVTHLYGCVHIGILPTQLKDGVPQKERLFDEQRIDVIEESNREAATPPFELGNTIKDKITGLTGIATMWYDELNGTSYVGLTPKELHEGRPIEAIVLSSGRVEVVEATQAQVSPHSSATSGSITGEYTSAASRITLP